MKTFEINEELEHKLEKIKEDLKLSSVKEVITLGLHMINLINTIEKEQGSLLIQNKGGQKIPLCLSQQRKESMEEKLLKELKKKAAKKTSKTKNSNKPKGKISK